MLPIKKKFKGPSAVAVLLAAGLGLLGWVGLTPSARATSRIFRITQTIEVRIPDDSSQFRLWIPIPSDSRDQTVSGLTVQSPVPHRVTTEEEFGNRLLFLEGRPSGRNRLEFEIVYDIKRFEQNGLKRKKEPLKTLSLSEKELYLKPRGLVVLNNTVREWTTTATKGKTRTLDKARAVYDHVYGHMSYDKKGEGWGRGDVVYACDVAKGNCTDFHSLFIAMMRAAHIPARFKMGFPLLKGQEGTLAGYHCWAEFFDEKRGWVPVDISAAWKDPARKKYFFGRLDQNRFQMSTGREINFSPRQKGPALNWLLLPHVEVDGKPHDKTTTQFKYESI